jgi:hypothetical protein
VDPRYNDYGGNAGDQHSRGGCPNIRVPDRIQGTPALS